MTFKDFIRARKAHDNPRGDLIADLLRDESLPDITSADDLLSHMRRKNACPEALREAALIFRQYLRTIYR